MIGPATQPVPSSGPLDQVRFQDFLSEMGDGAAVVIDLFQKQTADLLAHMRAAIQATDPTTLRENAHKLKGGCLTLAATQMAEHCEKLEACARKGTTDGTTALVDQIETDFAVALAALNAHTNNI